MRVVRSAPVDRAPVGQIQMYTDVKFGAITEKFERVLVAREVGHYAGRADITPLM